MHKRRPITVALFPPRTTKLPRMQMFALHSASLPLTHCQLALFFFVCGSFILFKTIFVRNTPYSNRFMTRVFNWVFPKHTRCIQIDTHQLSSISYHNSIKKMNEKKNCATIHQLTAACSHKQTQITHSNSAKFQLYQTSAFLFAQFTSIIFCLSPILEMLVVRARSLSILLFK